MTAPDVTATSIACIRCRTANAATARFCLTCGAPLQSIPVDGAASEWQAPPPPPPTAASFLSTSGFLAGSGPASSALDVDAPAAFAAALRAIHDAGGTVRAQQSPQLIRFEIQPRRGGLLGAWLKLRTSARYVGELALSPQGPRQTTARLAFRLHPSSRSRLIATHVAVFVLSLFLWSGLGILIGLADVAWTWSRHTSALPNELTQWLMEAMAQPLAAGSARVATPPPGPAPATPAMPPASNGHTAPTTASVIEQLRQLGELRDLGVVTPEEFEAKKTELLARL
jgi:hypothetical protein